MDITVPAEAVVAGAIIAEGGADAGVEEAMEEERGVPPANRSSENDLRRRIFST